MSKNGLRNGNGGDVLEIKGLSVRLPGEARPVLDNLDLTLQPGEVMGVAGRSGSGKSTLIHSVSGLVPWLHSAEVHGDVDLGGESLSELDPGQRAHLLATCLDRPDAQLFLPTVRQELEAARRLHGDSPIFQLAGRRLGVDRLMDRRITELSSGQRQRVALTVSLAASPRPVLLDEPTAHLDSEGVRGLVDVLNEGRRSGGSFLLSEQAGWRVANGVGSWSRLEYGRLAPSPSPRRLQCDQPQPAGRAVVVATRGLSVVRGGRLLLEEVDLEIRKGEIVLLTGPNGAGKSTLAYVLAGLHRPAAGAMTKLGRVALMLPSAELQLFCGTVAEEVAAADRTHAETARVLRRHRLERFAARAPWTLSRGERQRLVHAALDLTRPELMIVDEPGQGLDPEDMEAFVHLMHRRAEKGRAYLVISHRIELVSAAHRQLRIEGGRIVGAAP